MTDITKSRAAKRDLNNTLSEKYKIPSIGNIVTNNILTLKLKVSNPNIPR